MKKNPPIPKMNKVIHEFLDGKWAIVALTPGGHLSILNFSSTDFLQCAKMAKEKQDRSSNLKYRYRVVPKLKDYEFHYHYSWDALMPVVRKIATLILYTDWKNVQTPLKKWKAICRHLENPNIRNSHRAVYEFIEWFNRQYPKKATQKTKPSTHGKKNAK